MASLRMNYMEGENNPVSNLSLCWCNRW